MAQTIHTQLKVSLLDKVSGPMKKVLAANKKMAASFKKTARTLEKSRGPLKLIEDLKKQNEAFRKAQRHFRETQERLQALAREMRASGGGTAKMRAEYGRLQRQVRKAAQVFELQKQKTLAAKHALESAGIPVRRLSSAERELAREAGLASRMLERQKKIIERISAARERFHARIAKHGARMAAGAGLIYTGRRMFGALGAPVRQAVDFTAAFAGVKKVADFKSPAEEKAFRQALLDMAGRMPMELAGLADIASSAMESGMRGREALAFTELAAQAGVAFGMSADVVGEHLAKIKTALGMNVEQTRLFADAINHLSNNMASSAPDLVEFARRVGADAERAGFARQEMLAFGSAMIAAGATPDVAATSMRNMARALTVGASATKRQNKAFKALGLSAVEVARRMQKDAVGTTLEIFHRLKKLPKHQRLALGFDLFGAEARALGPLLNKLDALEQALRLTRTEQEYAGSALKEFETRAAQADMQFQKLRNQLHVMGVELGSVLLPPLVELAQKVGEVVQGITAWMRENPRWTKAIAFGAAAIAGLTVAGGVLITTLAGAGMAIAAAGFGLRMLGLRSLFAAAGSRTLWQSFGLLSRLKAIRWSSLIPRISWASLAGRLSWRMLVTPLKWGLRFIPVIGWAALAGTLAWDLLIKPLGWDKYLSIGQAKELWSELEKTFQSLDLTIIGQKTMQSFWAGLKSLWGRISAWWNSITLMPKNVTVQARQLARHGPRTGGAMEGIGIVPRRPPRKRATGGWMSAAPTLVGERGPELLYPTHRAWVAHNDNLKRLARMAAAASVAGALYYAPPAPATAAPAQTAAGGAAPVVQRTVHVSIQPGAIQIHAAGMNAGQLSDELGRRLADTLRATMADVEDAG